LAEALTQLAGDRQLRLRLGAAARDHVRARYSSPRLLGDVDRLYRGLLGARGQRAS
jgi:glycosyltransferase involved in cell wall biosynthesis